MRYPKVVVFGGGSGLSSILEGLKHYPLELKAIVSVADDGGSSGIIRNSFNISPPGDLRRVILSMSSHKDRYQDLFNYRFSDENNPFYLHPVGNIILTALCNMHNNSIIEATKHLSEILQVKGKIIPISDNPITLFATFEDGKTICGEEAIALYNKKIIDLKALPCDKINGEAILAIQEADMIIYSPGSLYTSLLASLCYPNILKHLNASKALKVYVANIMTQHGETDDFCLSNHINELCKYIGYQNLDLVLANNNLNVEDNILKKYEEKHSRLVIPDYDICNELNVIIKYGRLITIEDGFIRHDHFRNAAYLFNLLIEMEV